MNVSLDYKIEEFDSELLKNLDINYSATLFNKVAKLKEEYLKIGCELNGKEAEIKFTDSSHPSPVVEVDFNNRIKELTIVYRDVVDPITIPVEFIEADRSIYDAQVQKETNALIKPEHKTGNDLVNIYWNLVNDKVEIVKINLYSVSNNETRLIGKYKEEEAMFKSITGLAYGKYCYEIIELDGAGNEVARTDKIEFTLSVPNYSGRNTVTFSR